MAGELGIDPSSGWLDRIDETILAFDRDPGAEVHDRTSAGPGPYSGLKET